MNPAALLALISDLYSQVSALAQAQARIAELEAQLAQRESDFQDQLGLNKENQGL
jgi:hypothetical protein